MTSKSLFDVYSHPVSSQPSTHSEPFGSTFMTVTSMCQPDWIMRYTDAQLNIIVSVSVRVFYQKVVCESLDPCSAREGSHHPNSEDPKERRVQGGCILSLPASSSRDSCLSCSQTETYTTGFPGSQAFRFRLSYTTSSPMSPVCRDRQQDLAASTIVGVHSS